MTFTVFDYMIINVSSNDSYAFHLPYLNNSLMFYDKFMNIWSLVSCSIVNAFKSVRVERLLKIFVSRLVVFTRCTAQVVCFHFSIAHVSVLKLQELTADSKRLLC